jgi:hypothetical protein
MTGPSPPEPTGQSLPRLFGRTRFSNGSSRDLTPFHPASTVAPDESPCSNSNEPTLTFHDQCIGWLLSSCSGSFLRFDLLPALIAGMAVFERCTS